MLPQRLAGALSLFFLSRSPTDSASCGRDETGAITVPHKFLHRWQTLRESKVQVINVDMLES